jgi:serine/threonine protein kinase/tetratricopeptide (TPR) repeat protein
MRFSLASRPAEGQTLANVALPTTVRRVTATRPSDLTALTRALGDRFRIERELGAGGMATVYLAHDLKHDRPVALKLMRNGDAPLDTERFHREIRVVARLRHPFILPLYDSGEVAGSLYFVMPYIDGESLRARMTREGRLPVADAIEITRQIADALETAHGEGVIHRDVKPENILIARSGHALLADFGIARAATGDAKQETVTQLGMALGTVAYMSPEQAMGERSIDARSDVYALGCVLFEMLSGTAPFEGPSAMSVLTKHITAPPPDIRTRRADVASGVASVLLAALAKEPGERPASAREFASRLATSGDHASERPSPLTSAVAAEKLSIAVLPIENIGGTPEDAYFSEGMTEELTAALSRLEGLRVVSRTSTVAVRGLSLPLRAVAERLGVEFVVEGTARRAGTRLRLTAKLIRARDESPLWSERFDRTLDDVFAVQDEITERLVETISGALQLGGLRGQVPVPATRNLEAYDLYLLGRHHWYERSQDGMKRARDLFQQAIDLDPTYAPAWSGLADSLGILASWQFADPAEMFPLATNAAKRALELDASLAEAHASIGFVKMNWEWDWEGVIRELRRAIELNPNHETSHRWLSAFLAGIGRKNEAMPIAERAVLLDPLSVLPRMNLGIIHYLSHDFAAAEVEFRRVLAMQPGFARAKVFLSGTLTLQKRHDEAIEVARELIAESGRVPIYLWALGISYAHAGRMSEARELLEPLNQTSFPALYRAISHLVLGETDRVFPTLEEAIAQRSDWMYPLGRQPLLRHLYGDPRFEAIVRSLRLPPSPE